MLYYKKAIKQLELVNTDSIKDKIDSINKLVLPPKMLMRKKKTINED
jgi:hypothetical protein